MKDAEFTTLADMIRSHAAHRPDAVALTCQDRSVTYGELDSRSNRVASALVQEGVGPQDRVAFLARNGIEYFETLLGCSKANAVDVTVNWRLAPREIAYVVNDSQARVLIVGAEFEDAVASIESELAIVKKILVADGGSRYGAYEEWLDRAEVRDPHVAATSSDAFAQLYTSGTTGFPKGAILPNSSLAFLLPRTAGRWGITPQSVNLVVLPLFHIGGAGWAISGMYRGARSIVMPDVVTTEILDAIPRYRVTHTCLVPAILQLLVSTPGCDKVDFSSIQMIAYGASPISSALLVRCLQTFRCQFVQLYGMTETAGAVTELPASDHDAETRADLLQSCGRPLPWVELRVVDPETALELPTGSVGEVWVRSPQILRGYWNLPEETSHAITPEGWLRTGDAGRLDDAGYLYLCDRVKDMIISGGENVYPVEVENLLASHPGIADVAVIGVPDEKWGETVKAIAVRAPGSQASEADVIAFAREQLAHYKCPSSVDWVEDLPRTPSGKVLKRELREPYWAGASRRVH